MLKWLGLSILFLQPVWSEDYCFGFLNSHPDRKPIPDAEAEEIQKGHIAHMGRMAKAGHLLAAGPLLTPGGARGIVLYRCRTLDEAASWTSLDPAVQNKRLVVDVHMWRGPDAVGEPLASRLQTEPDPKYNMVRLPLMLVRKTDKWTGEAPAEAMAAHRQRIAELKSQHKIRMVGPIVKPGPSGLAGICVLPAMSLDEAKALFAHDPLVEGGYARVESYIWMVADEAIPMP